MNEFEQFETELRRVALAKPPKEFLSRVKSELAAATRQCADSPERQSSSTAKAPRVRPPLLAWLTRLRWLAPAAAAVIMAGVVLRVLSPHPITPTTSAPPATGHLKLDDVQIDRTLIKSFDAVATLPSGEPVRFRCREWMDDVILRDRARQFSIEERTPRVELVPVGFETY